MKKEEYEEAVKRGEVGGALVIYVEEHKSKNPAKVAVDCELKHELLQWMQHLRPKQVPQNCEFVFAERNGTKLHNLSQQVSMVAKKSFATILPTATSVRKAIATKAGQERAVNKVAVAHAMSHSTTTADKCYRAYDDTNVQGHQVIGKILEVPAGRKRHRCDCKVFRS